MNNINLPIGSIVRIQNGDTAKFIIGYTEENNTLKYLIVNYPEGLLSFRQVMAIDYKEIVSVSFEGYKNEKFEELNKYLNKEIENYNAFK